MDGRIVIGWQHGPWRPNSYVTRLLEIGGAMEYRDKNIILYNSRKGSRIQLGNEAHVTRWLDGATVVTLPVVRVRAWGEFETDQEVYRPAEVMTHAEIEC